MHCGALKIGNSIHGAQSARNHDAKHQFMTRSVNSFVLQRKVKCSRKPRKIKDKGNTTPTHNWFDIALFYILVFDYVVRLFLYPLGELLYLLLKDSWKAVSEPKPEEKQASATEKPLAKRFRA